MTTLRDTRRPLEFWDKMLALKQKYGGDIDCVAAYHEAMQNESHGLRPFFGLLMNKYTTGFLEEITYTYCRGDNLDEIKRLYVDEGIDRFIFVCGEIEKYRNHEKMDNPYWEMTLFYPNEVHSALSMICWFVCFETDPGKLGQIAPYIAQAGKDRLVDTILKKYQPDREIATEDKCGRTFKLLQSVLDVDESKAIKNLEKYLANWGKLMGTLKGLKSIGLTGTQGAKSNESLVANLDTVKNVSYRGFWAWEVALVVRFFDIDDSSFCDHEFYPKDLAHYRPSA